MTLIGLKDKHTGAIIAVHNLGEMYEFPVGYAVKDIDIVSIVVPEKLSNRPEEPPIDLKDFVCPECGNKPDYFSACCLDKANGFKGKFFCPSCSFVVFLKE